MPEWLTRVSAADPAAAPELSALWQRSAALEVFDHAFYSGDASAQQQLVTQLYSDDPGALRAMVAAATQLLESSANDSVARVPRTRGFSDTEFRSPFNRPQFDDRRRRPRVRRTRATQSFGAKSAFRARRAERKRRASG